MLSPARCAALAAGALVIASAAVASASAPTAGTPGDTSVRADEGFQGSALHTWQPGQRAVPLHRGRDRDGEFVTPRSRRPTVVVRNLRGSHTTQLRFSFQRRGRGPQTIAVFASNRVSLKISRRGLLSACAAAPHACRPLGRTHRGRTRWQRAFLELDAARGTVRARLGFRRTIRLRTSPRPEKQVKVGDVRRELGGPIAFDDISLVARIPAPAPTPATPPAPAAMPPPPRFFARDSIWNAPLPDDAPLDPRSAELTGAFRTGPWIQTTEYSTPIYTVVADEPRVRVTLDVTANYGATLQSAFASVPLPASARPASGADGHLAVHQPSTDSMWEFWHLRRLADGWHARWGGAMQGVSRNAGYFSPASWPGAGTHWGATATSLPLVAGTMLVSELQSGSIDHALAMSVPNARAGVFAFPAQRTDGTSADPLALPEGARLRLDPRLDLNALNLPPLARAMAVAAQRYGMIVRDKTGAATGFFAEDPTPTGANPYAQLYGGSWPVDLLAAFPWEHVQLLRMQLSALP
jgi:hypothetical protein